MKKFILIAGLFLSWPSFGQDISGQWNGILQVQGMELRLVFHFSTNGEKYSALLDSPDQGVSGIPVGTVIYEDSGLSYDPANTLRKVRCPVLALNGAKDVQVAPENLKAIQSALFAGQNDHVAIKEYPDLNHLFQECKSGATEEYATIEQTISLVVLEEISTWILKQVR